MVVIRAWYAARYRPDLPVMELELHRALVDEGGIFGEGEAMVSEQRHRASPYQAHRSHVGRALNIPSSLPPARRGSVDRRIEREAQRVRRPDGCAVIRRPRRCAIAAPVRRGRLQAARLEGLVARASPVGPRGFRRKAPHSYPAALHARTLLLPSCSVISIPPPPSASPPRREGVLAARRSDVVAPAEVRPGSRGRAQPDPPSPPSIQPPAVAAAEVAAVDRPLERVVLARMMRFSASTLSGRW